MEDSVPRCRPITVDKMKQAEVAVLKLIQGSAFPKETSRKKVSLMIEDSSEERSLELRKPVPCIDLIYLLLKMVCCALVEDSAGQRNSLKNSSTP